MIFTVDNLIIYIEQEENGLRLKTDVGDFLLKNQTTLETKEIIEKNYEIVKTYFQPRIGTVIVSTDLIQISLKVVLFYFSMYNLWRTMYEKEINRDLTFLPQDFEHPQTDDIIIQFFKEKYPNNYAEKCESMLKMSSEEFKIYDKNRQDFQNMF